MQRKIRHYFLRRKALKLFADKFLFEPLPSPAVQPPLGAPPPSTPAPAPATTFVATPEVPPTAPQPSNQPPTMPAPSSPPVMETVTPPAPISTTPKQEIVERLNPMLENPAKMDAINRRLNS